MSHPFVRPDSYTYADYYSWPDGIRGELVDGQFYVREPGPSFRHQRVAGSLFVQIHTFFDGKPCIAISAPLDVRLPRPGDDDGAERDVVQPDIAVICDRAKIDDRGCRGAPDWVIEVSSPSTRDRDCTLKRDLYARSGVRLYWIVSPQKRDFTVLRLGAADGGYGPGRTIEAVGRHAIADYPGLVIDWDRVFAD
ncbi:MAG TPA: Uma2 family endonuclease [Steroidobacteraceae bacterium]|nr:Uma2 family endonuclease [Steroidobacteraceae bacterium]